jgi:hypothetical protein
MNYRYTYYEYGPQGGATRPIFEDSEKASWGTGPDYFRSPFSSWVGAEKRAFQWLPWFGAAMIGLGVLIILFPMLLVIAVSGLFFFAGAVSLGLWWQVRERSQAHFDAAYEWGRAKRWFKERLAR